MGRGKTTHAKRAARMSETELEQRFPAIPWRSPLLMQAMDSEVFGFACRYCIAQRGFKADEIAALPKTEAEVIAHIREAHSQ